MIVTDLLGAKVRVINWAAKPADQGRLGRIVNVWLEDAVGRFMRTRYTVRLKDGRLLDCLTADDFVIEG